MTTASGVQETLGALVAARGGVDIDGTNKSDTVNHFKGWRMRAIHVGVAGTIKITHVDGSEATYTCVAGEILPVQAERVWSTGTTADGLTAMR